MSKLENDRLVKGLTRPTMILGVTFNFFVLNLTISMLSYIISNKLMILIFFMPLIHMTGYMISQREPLFVELFMIKMNKCNQCSNRFYHGKNSYDPLD